MTGIYPSSEDDRLKTNRNKLRSVLAIQLSSFSFFTFLLLPLKMKFAKSIKNTSSHTFYNMRRDVFFTLSLSKVNIAQSVPRILKYFTVLRRCLLLITNFFQSLCHYSNIKKLVNPVKFISSIDTRFTPTVLFFHLTKPILA